MMNPTLITRRRLLIAMALSPLLWQMRGAQAADVDPQRVVVGRAIVKKPDVFLFDEPLSNLDA
ncbi:hypothetical protein CDA33_18300, partial [Klebsiella pneumoniae]